MTSSFRLVLGSTHAWRDRPAEHEAPAGMAGSNLASSGSSGGGSHPSHTPDGTQDTPPRVPTVAGADAHPRLNVHVCVCM